jgi:hypothetical protein
MYAQAYFQLWLAINDKTRIASPVVKAVRKDLARKLALDLCDVDLTKIRLTKRGIARR